MPSVVLLGDSILDNWPYTRPAPDTTSHLTRLLGPAWTVTRLAEDGATMSAMPRQLGQLARRPDWAVVSIGGNDATAHLGLFERRVSHATQVLGELAAIGDDFSRHYDAVLAAVCAAAERVVLCTIYEVRLEPAPLADLARVPLALLNDWIVRLGAARGLTVLDLRSVCTTDADFVLQIEPSAQGAEKIAAALAALLGGSTALRSARVVSA
jgi:lysophospholipase L1-like esterase